ncbi:MAG: lipopolysaccharide transport periplasmic protein LptA [Gammaproteobacteria bacterium]|jgi:lipopolysaccharide export system protein LptA
MMSSANPFRACCRRSLLLLCALLPLTAWGLDADREQPITIEADKASLNDKTGFSVYEGNVRLQQGTLIFTGNRMTVQLTDKKLDTIVLTGNPATYVQRPQGKTVDQHAEAGRIEYYAIDERIILLDKARIWESGDEEFRSDRIVFNLKDDTVDAGGGGDSGRVHITLQPRNKDRNKDKDSNKNDRQADNPPAPITAPAPAPTLLPGPEAP